jgi:hypothetical protein
MAEQNPTLARSAQIGRRSASSAFYSSACREQLIANDFSIFCQKLAAHYVIPDPACRHVRSLTT